MFHSIKQKLIFSFVSPLQQFFFAFSEEINFYPNANT